LSLSRSRISSLFRRPRSTSTSECVSVSPAAHAEESKSSLSRIDTPRSSIVLAILMLSFTRKSFPVKFLHFLLSCSRSHRDHYSFVCELEEEYLRERDDGLFIVRPRLWDSIRVPCRYETPRGSWMDQKRNPRASQHHPMLASRKDSRYARL